MKIYLASPFEKQAEMRTLRKVFQKDGHSVIARWLDEPAEAFSAGDIHFQNHALRDLEDITACDLVVVNNPSDYFHAGTGGRHVELGFALGLKKEVILYGWPSNVFHALPQVCVVPHVEALREVLMVRSEVWRYRHALLAVPPY